MAERRFLRQQYRVPEERAVASPPAERWRVVVAGLAAALTVAGLVLPWWPDDFRDRGAGSGLEIIRENNWLIVSLYGSIGVLVHVVLAFVAVWSAGLTTRWRWMTLVAAGAGLWQLIAVRGATLINTTFAPYLGFVAALVLLASLITLDPSTRSGPARR